MNGAAEDIGAVKTSWNPSYKYEMRKVHLSSTPVLYESYYALRSASLGRSPPCL